MRRGTTRTQIGDHKDCWPCKWYLPSCEQHQHLWIKVWMYKINVYRLHGNCVLENFRQKFCNVSFQNRHIISFYFPNVFYMLSFIYVLFEGRKSDDKQIDPGKERDCLSNSSHSRCLQLSRLGQANSEAWNSTHVFPLVVEIPSIWTITCYFQEHTLLGSQKQKQKQIDEFLTTVPSDHQEHGNELVQHRKRT